MQLERSREFSRQFLDWVRGKGKVLIVAHDNPDPDSLAGAAALKHLLLKTTGQEAVIAYGGMIGRGENRTMAIELEIDAVHFDQIDADQFQVICMVDTQPGTGNNSFPDNRPVHLVIDHHPRREATDTCRWVDVREDYGASATILLEYLLANDVSFGTRLATILFYAIKSETQDLGRDWVRADREAYLYLLPLANNRILYRVTHPKVPRDYYFSYNRAIENSRIYDDLLVFNLYRVDNADIVAEMADFLLRMEGVELVLGMGHDGTDVFLSLRTSQPEINAGSLIRTLMADLGTAGGHHTTAGGQIRDYPDSQTALRKLERRLTRRLQEALNHRPVKGRRLIP